MNSEIKSVLIYRFILAEMYLQINSKNKKLESLQTVSTKIMKYYFAIAGFSWITKLWFLFLL